MPERRSETRAVRAGVAVDREHGAVIPPIHLSSTFSFVRLGEPRRYDYTRSGNPTRDVLGEALAELIRQVGARPQFHQATARVVHDRG